MGNFPRIQKKQKHTKRNKNKKYNKETVGAIIKVNEKSSSNDTVPVELESVDKYESDSEEVDTSSKSETLSESPNAQSTMTHVLTLVESEHNANGTMLDPNADEEEYCNEYNNVFDNKIVGAVMAQTELSYEDEDYEFIDHKDDIFKPIHGMWCAGGPMPHKKEEVEDMFFPTSNFPGNICGFNPEPKKYMLGCQER